MRLMDSIPDGVAADCLPLDRPEPVQGELAALVCRTEDVEVLYELFPTRDAMDEAFQSGANRTRAPEGECAVDGLAVTPYTVGGEAAGRVLCYTIGQGLSRQSAGEPASSHIEWTDENSSIYAHAIRSDLGDLSLYEWWLSSSGPVVAGEGDASAEKDLPPSLTLPLALDGAYLVAPEGWCAGIGETTCALHIHGDGYELVFTGDPSGVSAERGNLLLQKPNAVVFEPLVGYCFEGEQFGPPLRSPRPAVFELSGGRTSVSFERADGGRCAGPQKLAKEPWTRAPAGLIAVEQGSGIALLTAGGSEVDELTTGAETNPNRSPDWSPDGARVVFTGGDENGLDLYVMNDDGTGVERLTDVPGDEYTPAWSPDGSRIVFGFDDGGETQWRSGLVVVDPAGSGWHELLVRENERVEAPVWSADGTRIAFTVFGEAGPEPYVVDADGDDLARVQEEPGVVLSWTLDGQRIVISSEFDGAPALVSIRPDGSGARVLLADPPEGGVSCSTGRRTVAGSSCLLPRASGTRFFSCARMGARCSRSAWAPSRLGARRRLIAADQRSEPSSSKQRSISSSVLKKCGLIRRPSPR